MIDFRVSFDALTDEHHIKLTLLINGVPQAEQFVSADGLRKFLESPNGNYTIYVTEQPS